MKHIINTIILLFALGFLIITTPLINFFIDKELDNGDSVCALAKDVSSNASCNLDIFGGLIETSDEDTQHEFMCDNKDKNLRFSIYIFKTQAAKKEFLEANTKNKIYFQQTFKSYANPKHSKYLIKGIPDFYNPCFKQGDHYVICEDVRWDNRGTSQFNGEPYYHEFKGEDIDWNIPSSIKRD